MKTERTERIEAAETVRASRAAFEAWWESEMNTESMDLHHCEFPMIKPENQPYASHETQRGWMTWQASRKAAIEERTAWLQKLIDKRSAEITHDHCTQDPGTGTWEGPEWVDTEIEILNNLLEMSKGLL